MHSGDGDRGALVSTAPQRRFLVAAFGDPGHAFPAIALARALAKRGHRVVVETWERWREAVEGCGLEFRAAEEYAVFPPPKDGATAADAARALTPLLEELEPNVVVSDILTLAPALAAEAAGLKRATLIPHIYPVHEPGLPFFAFGVQPPRTAVGRAIWRAALPLLETGLRQGREELNEQRRVDLADIILARGAPEHLGDALEDQPVIAGVKGAPRAFAAGEHVVDEIVLLRGTERLSERAGGGGVLSLHAAP